MKTKESISADTYLEMNKEFWQELEIHCVAECCGIDAFDFSEETVKDVITYYDKAGVVESLDLLLNEIERSNLKYVSSSIFNERAKKTVFVKRINNIKQNIL